MGLEALAVSGRELSTDVLVDQVVFNSGDAREVILVGEGAVFDLDLLFLRQLTEEVP
jgi:hypothetical protein